MKIMKLKIKKQKGETLAESVVTIAIFGILLLGLTDFMSSQINFVARLYHRDDIINKAQILTANSLPKNVRTSNYNSAYDTKINIFEALREENQSFKATDITLSIAIKNFEDIASFDWDKDKRILTVKNGTENLQFALP